MPGSNHPHILVSVMNLGAVIQRQGQYVRVAAIYQKELEG